MGERASTRLKGNPEHTHLEGVEAASTNSRAELHYHTTYVRIHSALEGCVCPAWCMEFCGCLGI